MRARSLLLRRLALGVVALLFSGSLLATPQTMSWLLHCDWSTVCDELPPLLEEEVAHEAEPQAEPLRCTAPVAPDEALRLPRLGDARWHDAEHAKVTVPPPESR